MLPFARIIKYANVIVEYATKFLLHANNGKIDIAKPTRVINTVGSVPVPTTPAIIGNSYDFRYGYYTISAVDRADTTIGTGQDFTLEWYAYCTNNTSNNWYMSSGTGTTSGLKIYSGSLYLQGRAKGGSVSSSANIPLNTWTHFCILQHSGNVYLYINGILKITLTSDIWGDNNTPLRIGGYETNSLAYYDQIRITNKALYNGGSTITVPTPPLNLTN
ncbi:structural protein [Pectobacterium phage vB_PcaM_CBB]|uniref:Structural protein n=1 Tax=Pectobacterium phage vB_PcaM_CBB TaxID=2772511 RepID=A0A1L2CVR3_9CAUD|nr:structural protein [Pectobacterium phage vB_PcaM_CBB]AMM44111.1 structural protein [Pectobacterium phage vB_PcaM_CBB]